MQNVNPLSLLSGVGTLGSIATVLGLMTTLGAGAAYIVHEHDARIASDIAGKQAVAVAAEQAADSKRTIASLLQANVAAQDRLNALGKLKEAINAAPVTSTCFASPAVHQLIAGLRSRASGGNASAKGKPAAQPVAVQGRTAAAR